MESGSNQAPALVSRALTATELVAPINALPGWTAAPAGAPPAISRHWKLPDFRQAMALANAVAELAERLNHHPDLQVGWGQVGVRWTTHDAGGVTALDLQAARQTDALAAQLGAQAMPATPAP